MLYASWYFTISLSSTTVVAQFGWCPGKTRTLGDTDVCKIQVLRPEQSG